MPKIIYLEVTMQLLINSMNFKTQDQANSFMQSGFDEQETSDGVVYYIEN